MPYTKSNPRVLSPPKLPPTPSFKHNCKNLHGTDKSWNFNYSKNWIVFFSTTNIHLAFRSKGFFISQNHTHWRFSLIISAVSCGGNIRTFEVNKGLIKLRSADWNTRFQLVYMNWTSSLHFFRDYVLKPFKTIRKITSPVIYNSFQTRN